MERPIDVDITQHAEVRIDKAALNTDPTPEQRAAYKSKIAQVLDRTMTVDRLNVALPDNLSSYWCPNDGLSITSAELRGYVIDTEFAARNSLNDAGNGEARIADVVHMVRPKWMTEEERKLERQRYIENHIRDRRKQKEEKDFESNSELPTLHGSKTSEVTGPEIAEVLKPEK